MPVSQALAKHPKYFNSVFTQTLRAGEASGQFGEVAGRLADYQEKEVTRRGQVTSALVYPGVLATTAFGVIIFLITFVLPRLSGVFAEMGNDLPLTTKMLLATSAFITQNWSCSFCRVWSGRSSACAPGSRRRPGRRRGTGSCCPRRHRPVVQKATVSRFARVLGTLVYGGVPILEALEIAGLSASNRVFLKSAQAVEEEVRAGRPIAEAMRDAGGFPPVLTHMVAVGEETGDLPKMLGRVADSLDFEVDTGMRRLVVAGRAGHRAVDGHRRRLRRPVRAPADLSGAESWSNNYEHQNSPVPIAVARFTLIEMLVVILILAILAALIIPRLVGRTSDAKIAKAKSDIATLSSLLQQYRLDNDRYPTTEEGLNALRVRPSSAPNWKGPYTTKDIPTGPLGQPLRLSVARPGRAGLPDHLLRGGRRAGRRRRRRRHHQRPVTVTRDRLRMRPRVHADGADRRSCSSCC